MLVRSLLVTSCSYDVTVFLRRRLNAPAHALVYLLGPKVAVGHLCFTITTFTRKDLANIVLITTDAMLLIRVISVVDKKCGIRFNFDI
ncbi:hypothetical protein EmuJ_000152100 [Echinococcus multilocularis]|uniref:Uncharacterized protein n=1 Tax=Echinococcus multilocularis TaxID=6211 RepID=A0A087VZH3_ECHMU|nr:hypothetical protein EmuJ_000152100 [Echinococcus multilocularis]